MSKITNKNLPYKKFIELAKFLVEYNKKSLFGKLKFYIELPFRFIIFRKLDMEKLDIKTVKTVKGGK